jgi:hypothetical protein
MEVCATVPPLAHETDEHQIACWLSDATLQAGGLPSRTVSGGAA